MKIVKIFLFTAIIISIVSFSLGCFNEGRDADENYQTEQALKAEREERAKANTEIATESNTENTTQSEIKTDTETTSEIEIKKSIITLDCNAGDFLFELTIDLGTKKVWGKYEMDSEGAHLEGSFEGTIDEKTLEINATYSGTFASEGYEMEAAGGSLEGVLNKDHTYASGTLIDNNGVTADWEGFEREK